MMRTSPPFTRRSLLGGAIGLSAAATSSAAGNGGFDVVVYGGTAGGVMAAVAAAKEGARVALVEPGSHPGGMVSGGLSKTDMDRQEPVIGGLTRKFFEALGAHYAQPVAWSFEPKIAEATFRKWLRNAGVKTYFHSRLQAVAKEGTRLMSLRVEQGLEFQAAVFIDSSYEGDLMKAAGVSYTVGREGRAQYGEGLAGRQDLLPGHHQFRFPVEARDRDGKLLPYVVPQEREGQLGEGDGKFQSYCFRLCLTDVPENRMKIGPPPGYTASRYLMLRRYIESAKGALTFRDLVGIGRLPNGKVDANSNGPVSTDLLGASWEYPDASYARRRQIWDEHLHWAQGFLYFLQNDASVPTQLRAETSRWGLPKDEFVDNNHWPHQLYVREGRRMKGEYILTQDDLEQNRHKPDSIGMAGYNIDIREVQWLAHKVYRFPQVTDEVFTEGYISYAVAPWEIPYRALLPRPEEARNLLVDELYLRLYGSLCIVPHGAAIHDCGTRRRRCRRGCSAAKPPAPRDFNRGTSRSAAASGTNSLSAGWAQ